MRHLKHIPQASLDQQKPLHRWRMPKASNSVDILVQAKSPEQLPKLMNEFIIACKEVRIKMTIANANIIYNEQIVEHGIEIKTRDTEKCAT